MMGEAYPELVAERETIARWVGDEEESFGRTLERGTELLERLVAEAERLGTSWIDAADAFKLHDTYGFPYDLTKELLAERGLSVDDARLRGADGGAAPEGPRRSRHRARLRGPPRARDRLRQRCSADAASSATRRSARPRASPRSSRRRPRPVVKLEESPFYAEGGGQVADSGCCAGAGERRGCSTSTGSARTRCSRWSPGPGRSEAGRGGRGRGRPRDPPRDDAQPHRDAPPACGPARAARRPTFARRARRCVPKSCASTSPTARRSEPGGATRRRGPRQ